MIAFATSGGTEIHLGPWTINCLMHADDLLIISPSPEGLQQSLNVIHRHAQH